MEYLHFSEDDILERVDEYSLYCHYIGFDPLIGKKYSSPIRTGDTDPSFAIFEKKYYNYGHLAAEFLWKDQALNLRGPKDIFSLVQLLFNLDSRVHARWKICRDFQLGGAILDQHETTTLVYKEQKYLDPINIRVKSQPFSKRDISYWQHLNVSESSLRKYNVSSVQCFWITENQIIPNYPNTLGFAYRISSKYQLYFPFQKRNKKFRTNWDHLCIPGFAQLTGNDLLIVTKAYKDVLCINSFGYDVIAPRGENIMLSDKFIAYANKRYKRVVTLFDNDGKHKAQWYPWQELHVPVDTGQKDTTDYCTKYGIKATGELLKYLLHEKP